MQINTLVVETDAALTEHRIITQPTSTSPGESLNPNLALEGVSSPIPNNTSTLLHQERITGTTDPLQGSETSSQPPSIEEFLDSISIPLQQPLLQEGAHNSQMETPITNRRPQRDPETLTQRKSTRLAKKAELSVGKDSYK